MYIICIKSLYSITDNIQTACIARTTSNRLTKLTVCHHRDMPFTLPFLVVFCRKMFIVPVLNLSSTVTGGKQSNSIGTFY